MANTTDDQTGVMYNKSDNEDEFVEAHESSPINSNGNKAFSNEYDKMMLDENIAKTTFIEVVNRRKKRFRTTIKCIHVPGKNLNEKINNIYELLANKEGFLECKPFFDKSNKEAWITAIFDNQDAANASTEMNLFENNEFKLTLLKDRGDEEVQHRTLVVRDLPLDVNRNLLKVILENTFGKIETLRTRTAGPWYRADVIFEKSESIENNLDCWAIQYKKDLCRVAPAYFTKDDIDMRNAFTVKLTNLPFGTTPIDLKEILRQVKAKTCFIPRTRSRYTRKRFAYVSFASEDDIKIVLTNVRVKFNGTELYWEAEDTKTCHKCGSPKHLITNCEEKESAENYKEYKNQFSNIYSRYKVPNYKNFGKKPMDNRSYTQKPSIKSTNKSIQSEDNNIQKMMENLLKSFTENFEKKFENITKQINEVNDRIKLIEIKTGLDKSSKPQPKPTLSKNNNNKYNMEYIPTKAALEKNLQDKSNCNKKTENQEQDSNNNIINNKRPLSENENSSEDDKNQGSNHSKPRRKSIRLFNSDSNNNTSTFNHESEINDIKTTQNNLQKDMLEMKNLIEQFTIKWYNSQHSHDGNGSSSSNVHQ